MTADRVARAPVSTGAAGSADEHRRGIIVVVAGMVLITIVDAAAKQLGTRLNPLQVVWGYYLGFMAAYAAVPSLTGRQWRRVVRTSRPGLQVLRAAMLVGSLTALFASLPHLPLADATAISFAAPLFVALLSIPLLGERVDAHRWGAILAGFAGVFVVVRPGSAMFQWVGTLPLLGAVFFAVYQIVTRPLARLDDPLTTLLYTGGGGLLLTSIVVGLVWRTPTAVEWLVFAGMGVLGVTAHFLIVKAFGLAPASLLAPFNYARIVGAVALGYALFGNVPDALTILGGLLIVASGLYLVWRERQSG